MREELAAVVEYSEDKEGRHRTCLLPVNESVPLVEIKTRLNALATKLQEDDDRIKAEKNRIRKLALKQGPKNEEVSS